VGLFFPNGAMWVLSVAPAAMRGRCSGGLSAALNVGQFLSPIALYPVVMRYGTATGFALAALCLLLIACAIVLALRWRSARPARP
jgi:MFS family permease